MARVLCVWEQGANLGHLANLRLAMEAALQAGHQVSLVARQLHEVRGVLGDLPITVLPAPYKQNVRVGGQEEFLSYTHLLQRQCFATADELATYVAAWRTLYALLQPDLVVFEHSPTALIAALDGRFKKVLTGGGFAVPLRGPAGGPFQPFPTTNLTPAVRQRLLADDAQLLQLINQALRSLGCAPLVALDGIYGQADASLLTTWPELDHYGARAGAFYIGALPPPRQALPVWPAGAGPKVLGYLSVMPGLEALLQALQAAGVCALLLVRDLPAALRQRYTSAHMAFVDHAVDLHAAATQVAWVLNNGNHGSVAHFALAGVPQLMIPLHQEHLFVALRMLQHGAGAMAYQDQPAYGTAVAAMQNPALRDNAQALARTMAPQAALDAPAQWAQTLAQLLG